MFAFPIHRGSYTGEAIFTYGGHLGVNGQTGQLTVNTLDLKRYDGAASSVSTNQVVSNIGMDSCAATIAKNMYIMGGGGNSGMVFFNGQTASVLSPLTGGLVNSPGFNEYLNSSMESLGTDLYLVGSKNFADNNVRKNNTLTGAWSVATTTSSDYYYNMASSKLGSTLYFFGGASQVTAQSLYNNVRSYAAGGAWTVQSLNLATNANVSSAWASSNPGAAALNGSIYLAGWNAKTVQKWTGTAFSTLGPQLSYTNVNNVKAGTLGSKIYFGVNDGSSVKSTSFDETTLVNTGHTLGVNSATTLAGMCTLSK